MPRAKADNVVIHRIEFGGKERELLEGATAAWQFNRVASPIIAGMSDVSFMVVLGGFLAIYYPDIKIPTSPSGMEEIVDAIDTGIRAGIDRARVERETSGEALLDDSTGVRDLLGRLYFNLTNPNWSW